jgi:hypothetical protein
VKKSGDKELKKVVKDILKNGMSGSGRPAIQKFEAEDKFMITDGYRALYIKQDFGAEVIAETDKVDLTTIKDRVFNNTVEAKPQYNLPELEKVKEAVMKKEDTIVCTNDDGEKVVGYNPK